MRAAVIEDGKVVNVILVDSLDALPNLVDGVDASVGDLYVDGAFVTPAPVIPVPPSVSMRQARLALLGAGLLDSVNAAIAAVGGAAQIEWEYASEVRRDSPLVASMGVALSMDEAALDALFVQAAGL